MSRDFRLCLCGDEQGTFIPRAPVMAWVSFNSFGHLICVKVGGSRPGGALVVQVPVEDRANDSPMVDCPDLVY